MRRDLAARGRKPHFLALLTWMVFLVACRPLAQSPSGLPSETPPAREPLQTTSIALPTEAEGAATDQPAPLPTRTATKTPGIPTVPPEASPPASLSSLKIAFVRGGKLWLWQNGTETLLTEGGDGRVVRISDDGELIVFLRELISTEVDNELSFLRESELWAINRDGTDERLLIGLEDLRRIQSEDPGVVIHRLDWIPGTHSLLFNTQPNYPYPHKPLDDLHIVDADTDLWSTLLAPGEGGDFYPSPDGQRIAITSETEIKLIGADGSGLQTLLTYPEVPVFGEGWYHATPVWATDSNSLVVAIPSPDPFGDPTATIWHLPVDGSSLSVLSQIETQIPYIPGEGSISPDLSWVINITFGQDPNKDEYIHIQPIEGGEGSELYLEAYGFELISWAPDSAHFALGLRRGPSHLYLAKVGGDSMTPIEEAILDAITWIDSTHFLYPSGSSQRPQLSLGRIDGPSRVLLVSEEPYDFIQFDLTK